MPTRFELTLIDGPTLAKRRWRIDARLCIGRAEDNQLILAAPSVSRQHAVIEAERGGWTLRDCRSPLGTRLNELPLAPDAPAALHAGDVVGIGPWRFRVDADAGADSSGVDEPVDAPRIDLIGRLGNLAEQRLELLLRCAGEVATARDEHALADTLAEYALLGSGYARAAVLWRVDDALLLRSLRPVGAADANAFRCNAALVASAEAGELARIEIDDAALAQHVPASGPLRRALCAPLMLDGRAAAFLYLDAPRAARRGHTDAPTFCHALARLAALALANLRRLDSERARAKLDADLDRAREVQRRLLPDDRAPIGGVCCALHLSPGRTVAGDIADVFTLHGGGAVALLGDVSGAGLGAGLVMASVQSFLRAELGHHRDPARAVARLNAHLYAQASRGCFVTLWLGVFDPSAQRCDFVDAGHGHAILTHPDRAAAPIGAHGNIPLGIEPGARFHAETLHLARDQLVLLYSDGVTEQRAPDGTPFGRAALLAALHGATTPQAAVAGALAALHTHAADAPPDDDTTVLALGWSG